MDMTKLIATFFYTGLAYPAPGTWGSLAALPAAALIFWLGGLEPFLVAIVVTFFLGWWATAEQTRGSEDHDPSEIVIDEVVGQWIALVPVFIGISHYESTQRALEPPVYQNGMLALWPGWLTAFVFFRIFDIGKPGPIGWADRLGGPIGVMLDDVIAGIFAGIATIAVAFFYHLVFFG